MSTADLSVVMPNFNHARFLPRALDAILSQSLAAREVLVLDDASTDDSVHAINGYARKHGTIRLVRNERNLGVVGTMNRGLGLANSTYVLFAAADDYILPGFFEKVFAQFAAHPQAGLCTALDSYQQGEAGTVQSNSITSWGDTARHYAPYELVRTFRHTIPGHATVCRHDALVSQGGFHPELRWYCDWFAFLVVAFRHGACQVPEMLAVRVLMDENYSASAKPGDANVQVLGKFLELMTSCEYRDVAPAFRRNGAAAIFGTDLIRAAARRSDCWHPDVLGFLNGFTSEQYETLAEDPDPTVKEIAALFLGPVRTRMAREAERLRTQRELDAVKRMVPPCGLRGKAHWLAKVLRKRLLRAGETSIHR